MFGAFRKIRDLLKLKRFASKKVMPPKMLTPVISPKPPLVKNLFADNDEGDKGNKVKLPQVDWRKMNLKPDLPALRAAAGGGY